MSSPHRPVFPPPALASAESSPAASSTQSSPEGGVRLDAGEFTPPPSQLFRRNVPVLTRAGNNASDDDESSSEDEESGDESGEHASATTPVGERGTRLWPIDEEATSSESDDSDDVFSPASSAKSGPLATFAQRLQLSATRSQAAGMTQISTDSARATIRHSRSVTFKEEPETISAEATPTLSPTMTLGERRLARRAATIGNDVAQAVPEPIRIPTVQPNVFGGHQTGDVDAQGLYPPTACVFVANLPEPEDDRSLEAAVTRAFCAFGTVFVKIRRDNNNMPFAFCQYTKDEDAVRAMEDGKGIMIIGRPCRTEMVKANRSFIIYKRNRMTISVDEARGVMENYGAISSCERLDEDARKTMKLPPSVLVEFVKFDPARDTTIMTRQNLGYAVEPYDARKKAQVTRSTGDEAFLRQYETDRRSVYVAGLPLDIEKDEVARYFAAAGEVVNVELIRRTSENGKDRVFAFVEFTRLDIPDIAIARLDNTNIRNDESYTLRVQRKEVKPPRTPKRVQSMNQLETRVFDRNRLASPRSHGSLNVQDTPRRGYHGTSAPAQAGAQSPETPRSRSHQMQAPGATQSISPVATIHHGGPPSPMHPGMMYYGYGQAQAYSPPGYAGQHMQGGPAIYGTTVPNTPRGFSQPGMNPFYPSGAFWPAANLYSMPDQTGSMNYGFLATLESPTRPSGTGPIGSGFGHGGFGHPVGSASYHGNTMGQSGTGIGPPGPSGLGHLGSGPAHLGSGLVHSGSGIVIGHPGSRSGFAGHPTGHPGGRSASQSGDRMNPQANDMARPDDQVGRPGKGTKQSESDN